MHPVGANYLQLLTQPDYLIPTQASSNLQLQLVGLDAGLALRPDATLQIGIYQGNGQFEYVTVASNGNLWQNYTVGGGPGAWSITSGGSNVLGTLNISGLPTPATTTAGQLYWYQIVLSDTSGDLKVYDLYATATATAGQVQTAATSVAADGGATFPPGTLGASFIQLDLNAASSLPSGMLTFFYNNQQSNNAGGAGRRHPVQRSIRRLRRPERHRHPGHRRSERHDCRQQRPCLRLDRHQQRLALGHRDTSHVQRRCLGQERPDLRLHQQDRRRP